MNLCSNKTDNMTGEDLPIFESFEEIQAALSTIHATIGKEAYFDLPEKKTLVLKLLEETEHSITYLSNRIEDEDTQDLTDEDTPLDE